MSSSECGGLPQLVLWVEGDCFWRDSWAAPTQRSSSRDAYPEGYSPRMGSRGYRVGGV